MDKNNFQITISWSALWRVFFMIILTASLFVVKEVFLIVFLALVISAALDAPVNFLENRGVPRILGTFIIFIILLSVVGLVLYIVVPFALNEFQQFILQIGDIADSFPSYFNMGELVQKINSITINWNSSLFSSDTSLTRIIRGIFGSIIAVITVIFISFYLTISRSGVEKFLRAVLPLIYEEYAVGFYHRVRRKLGFWLQGQIILMLMVAVLVFSGLKILGVKYSFLLAVVAGFLEIVPIAGPIFSGTLGVLVALPVSWLLALYTALLFFLIQQFENHVLVPLVMGKTIGMDPVIVIVAILTGWQLAGVIGIVLGVPAAVVFQELAADWEKSKIKERGGRLEI